MEIKAVDAGEPCDEPIKDSDIQIAELVKERVYGVLLVLVKDRHNGIFKIHKGDQPLIEARLEPAEVEGVIRQVIPVFLYAALPVPFVNIRPLNFCHYFICILDKRLTRSDHRTAGLGDILPLDAEHVLPAAFHWIKGRGFEYKARAHYRGECAV